jgi:hypothetical protein
MNTKEKLIKVIILDKFEYIYLNILIQILLEFQFNFKWKSIMNRKVLYIY